MDESMLLQIQPILVSWLCLHCREVTTITSMSSALYTPRVIKSISRIVPLEKSYLLGF